MTEKYKVYLTKSAQKDLEHIFDYIAADSIGNAADFVLRLEQKIYSLDELPERNPFISENRFFGTDYRHLIHKKYRIIYKIAEDSVFIIRIVHGAKILEPFR